MAGHGTNITRAHLLTVAHEGGIEDRPAQARIDHWTNVVRKMSGLVKDLPIRKVTLHTLLQTTQSLCEAVTARS